MVLHPPCLPDQYNSIGRRRQTGKGGISIKYINIDIFLSNGLKTCVRQYMLNSEERIFRSSRGGLDSSFPIPFFPGRMFSLHPASFFPDGGRRFALRRLPVKLPGISGNMGCCGGRTDMPPPCPSRGEWDWARRTLPRMLKMQKKHPGEGGEKSARFFSGEHHYYITAKAVCKPVN